MHWGLDFIDLSPAFGRGLLLWALGNRTAHGYYEATREAQCRRSSAGKDMIPKQSKSRSLSHGLCLYLQPIDALRKFIRPDVGYLREGVRGSQFMECAAGRTTIPA